MNATIERVTTEDLPAIAELSAVIWRQHYPGIISHAQIEYMLNWMFDLEEMQNQIANGILYEKLVCDDRLIGFATHGFTTDAAAYKLDKLYILAEFQGKGHGKHLLEHVVAVAKCRGSSELFLAVNKQNKNAIEVYQKSGFQIRESVVNDIGRGFVMDDYVMVRSL